MGIPRITDGRHRTDKRSGSKQRQAAGFGCMKSVGIRCVKNTSRQRRHSFSGEQALQSFLKGGRTMAYRNAQEIFPEGLLRQIQRYVSGETIYVPAREEKKA